MKKRVSRGRILQKRGVTLQRVLGLGRRFQGRRKGVARGALCNGTKGRALPRPLCLLLRALVTALHWAISVFLPLLKEMTQPKNASICMVLPRRFKATPIFKSEAICLYPPRVLSRPLESTDNSREQIEDTGTPRN